MTTLATLSISYELTSDARNHLGADALNVWARALEIECERSFPGVVVDVAARWSTVDASRFDVTGETADGVAIGGSKRHFGAVEIDIADSDCDDVPAATLRAIADGITLADHAAWERACDAA